MFEITIVQAKVLMVVVLGLIVVAGLLVEGMHRRLRSVESDIRMMKPPVPIRPTQPMPEPPPMRRYQNCIKCGASTCREGYDRYDPFLCNTCYESMPPKPWIDGECKCGCDGYFAEHDTTCEHMVEVRAWRAEVLTLVASPPVEP